jgi:hypothetical protein
MDKIDWPGLVSAVILLITAITLAINLWNQRQIADLHSKVTEIDGKLQEQMNTKKDKPGVPPSPSPDLPA